MKKILSIAASILIVLSLAACGGDEIIGTWDIDASSKDSISFYKDGTFDMTLNGELDPDNSGTYKRTGDKQLELDNGNSTLNVEYEINENNHTIVLRRR